MRWTEWTLCRLNRFSVFPQIGLKLHEIIKTYRIRMHISSTYIRESRREALQNANRSNLEFLHERIDIRTEFEHARIIH